MRDYQSWCNYARELPLDLPGVTLSSHNKVKVVNADNGQQVLLKIIGPHVVYIPRIKLLGEAAFSLLDYFLSPSDRVTPNVCPISSNAIWREFIPGIPGEVWRGQVYKEKKSIEATDLLIIDQVLESRSAQRLALLDFITLNQDRSARNWIVRKDGVNEVFCGVDNGMLWPYRGKHLDKAAVQSGKVAHLTPPMEALISYDRQFKFMIGLFSSLFAGSTISDGLLYQLQSVFWPEYLSELTDLIGGLGYPVNLVEDWRFRQMWNRAEWLLKHGRFPSPREVNEVEWQRLINKPVGENIRWERRWEITNLDAS